jgi:hypothetical protein
LIPVSRDGLKWNSSLLLRQPAPNLSSLLLPKQEQ